MYTGGGCDCIVRICTADVSVRSKSSGMRRMRIRPPSSRRTNGIACSRARIVCFRSSGCPITLTQTRAVLRSGAVSTSVTVTNPIRGSWTSFARIAPISSRSS